jgi:hypothetical protein
LSSRVESQASDDRSERALCSSPEVTRRPAREEAEEVGGRDREQRPPRALDVRRAEVGEVDVEVARLLAVDVLVGAAVIDRYQARGSDEVDLI